jgi:bacterioferritin-associated ferredoxin
MIVCVCRSLNCRDVGAAIRAGARTPAQIHSHFEGRINCGKCTQTMCEMLHEAGAQPHKGDRAPLAAE